jgi:type VI protein secretion system component VasK
LSSSLLIIIALVFVVNLAFIAWAVTDLLQREKVRYLPKTAWLIIIAVVIFGSVFYLLFGRERGSAG